MIIDLNGRTEGVIPRSQQSRAERYSQGDRIRAVIVDVHTQPKGPQVVLSRTDPLLLIRLFEMEVPEIYDGTVIIKDAVREPGERAKIAVASRERDVDPVGACVGMKGSRVQSIIRELRGEKIDIIPWHEDIVVYAQSALAPARITRVSVTSGEEEIRPQLDVIVDDDQLSLAIGKRGLNVRLAAELIGARIDIKSEDEVKGEVADALTQMLQVAMAEARAETHVQDVEGLDPELAQMLEDAGYDDLDSLLNATPEDLAQIEGIDVETAKQIIEVAQEFDIATIEEEDVSADFDEDEDEDENEDEEMVEAEPGETIVSAEPSDAADDENSVEDATTDVSDDDEEEPKQGVSGEPADLSDENDDDSVATGREAEETTEVTAKE
jgi:transcription termination/antitermination protein NusA